VELNAPRENDGGGEQIIGREGETATFLSRCPFNSELRGFGFAPRQLNRWASSRFPDTAEIRSRNSSFYLQAFSE